MGAGLHAQLTISQAMTPQQMVQDILLGGGVTASNITFNGVAAPPANQPGRGTFTAVNSNLGLDGGVILSTGNVTQAANPASFFASSNNGTGSDPDLVAISGGNINDRSVLEFDFIPTGDTLRFRYVFGSEEYPNFVCSFNDVFGFFLSGPGIAGPYTGGAVNIALLPGTNTPVSIYNVNNGQNNNPNHPTCPATNPQFYVNNTGGTTVAYNGFTVVLTAFALVECGQTYHIKMAIGDAGDSIYDSAVFLEEGSFTSSGQVQPTLADGPGVINGNTMLRGCGPYELVFQRLGDLTDGAIIEMFIDGDAIPGVDYSPALPTSLNYAPGQEYVSIFLDVPPGQAPPVTVEILIEQIIQCAGVILMTLFEFNIEPPPPLEVTSQDLNSVCGQVNTLTPVVSGGMGEYTYLWNTGDTTESITVSPGVTTTYSVTVGDICGIEPITVDFTITLPIYPPLEMEVTPPTAIDCLGNDDIAVISVSGGNNVFSYEWTLDGNVIANTPTINVPASAPTWYVVTVTEGCGTSITDSVLVSTVPLPPIEIITTGNVTVICPGDSTLMSITNITGGNGVYTIQWTNQGGQVLSNTSGLEVGVPADHTYTITVEDQCGTVGSTTITTFLPIYAPFQLSVPASRTICAGDSMLLHAQVTGGSGYYYVDWHGMDFTDPMLWVAPWNDTDYTVTVTDQCGEERTRSLTVGVEHVHVEIVVTNKGQDDWYLQAATLPYAETWLWDMGDGTRYRGPEVYHSYYNTDDHWAYLWITTPNGCPGMDSVFLEVPAHIYFPNAFTPDGDGVNDTFGPVGHGISEFEMQIFDRWGQEVFRTTDLEIRWDGTVNGSGAPKTDVYVYKYRAVGHYFPATEGYGHVTLIR
jgi:gliding motility-associated-like protein